MTTFAHGQLRALIERIERLEEEKKAIAADIKEIYAEAKANGFDTKILRAVVALRRKDPAERQEDEALIDVYLAALGMSVVIQREPTREPEVPHDPATGEIIETESLAAGAPTVPQGQAAGEAITSHADLPAAASDLADQSHLPEREATGAGDAIAPESPPPDFPDMPPFLRRYTPEQLLGAG